MIVPQKYNNDVETIFLRLIPFFWKESPETDIIRTKWVEYLKTIISCLNTLQLNIYNKAVELNDFLNITGIHLTLEEYLNDTYDPNFRRIYIIENDLVGIVGEVWYQSGETDTENKVWYQSGESDPASKVWFQSEEGVGEYNFTIMMPISVVFDEDILRSKLNNFIIATKQYNILTF